MLRCYDFLTLYKFPFRPPAFSPAVVEYISLLILKFLLCLLCVYTRFTFPLSRVLLVVELQVRSIINFSYGDRVAKRGMAVYA